MNLKIILAGIILIGLILRSLFINSSPPSLYGDELTLTLDAYSILQTGHDQLGNFMPLTFSMGAGRPPGYVYGSIPFVAIFGPSVLGARGLSILSGLGIILLMYFLGKRLFSEKVGIAAAFITAVSPWDLSLSRGGFEAHFALFLALLGTYLFLKAAERPKLYILSAISFGLTLHTYPTYKISLLLFLPLLFWFMGTRTLHQGRKYFGAFLIILFILGSLSLSQLFYGGSENRFFSINIFSQEKLRSIIEEKINFERSITKLPQTFSKYFHNKPTEYGKILIENYLQNFSVDFLILHGDRNPRHNMATMGEFYAVSIILILIAVMSFWQKQPRIMIFLILWLVLAPIPTAIIDLPHGLRSSFMLPPLIIFSALGLLAVWNMKNKVPLILISLLFVVQFLFFIQKLYFLSPGEYSSFWSYSAKLASGIAQENRSKYDYIILSDKIDSIEFAYPIYAKIDPRTVISQNQKRSSIEGNLLKKFDNVYIGYIPDTQIEGFIKNLGGSVLYIGSPDEKKSLQNYETVSSLDLTTALVIKRISN